MSRDHHHVFDGTSGRRRSDRRPRPVVALGRVRPGDPGHPSESFPWYGTVLGRPAGIRRLARGGRLTAPIGASGRPMLGPLPG